MSDAIGKGGDEGGLNVVVGKGMAIFELLD
jgi:hypothetical protein